MGDKEHYFSCSTLKCDFEAGKKDLQKELLEDKLIVCSHSLVNTHQGFHEHSPQILLLVDDDGRTIVMSSSADNDVLSLLNLEDNWST
jgi:hypothetical protein